ncbi:MAG: hypothetical protein JWO34_298 [Arthrobacter sp.]|nr:hypothetical protein [Arthrobacter sp.]
MSTAITVGLVGCASQKLKRPAPTRELYVYQLFKKASAYAELTCDRWYLLSAKHGLVHPDTVLEPYDMRLGTNHRTSPPIHQWGARVKENSTPSWPAWRTSRWSPWRGSSTASRCTTAGGRSRFR